MTNVPNVPGVPALLGGFASAVVALLTGDAPGVLATSGPPQWGLFLNGEPVVVADSVTGVGIRSSSSVPTYPMEGGSFQNYNKVQRPFDGRLRYSTGGTFADKQAFIQSVDDAKQSLDLYDLLMPDFIYSNVSVIDYFFDRTAVRSLGLLSIDVLCKEIRLTAQTAFSTSTAGAANSSDLTSSPSAVTRGPDLATPIATPQDASAAPQQNDGNVQPQTPSAAQSSQFSSALEAGNL